VEEEVAAGDGGEGGAWGADPFLIYDFWFMIYNC
jgi:hypothetical protein